jgi:hypothetical protein
MTCIRNGAFFGEIPKTTFQEEINKEHPNILGMAPAT